MGIQAGIPLSRCIHDTIQAGDPPLLHSHYHSHIRRPAEVAPKEHLGRHVRLGALKQADMRLGAIHLDGQPKVSHLGRHATRIAAIMRQQHDVLSLSGEAALG